MGYTPLFDTLTKGTLCGRWPDIGLWPIVLSMADKHGVVDATPMHIASVTGLDVEEVIACMDRFCQPDPYSRSQEAGGARLELLDPELPWGWRIVNHGKYREKARKKAFDERRRDSGDNADRMRGRREEGPTRPAMTRDDPREPDTTRPTNANANSNTEGKERSSRRNGARVPSRHIDLVFEHWQTVHKKPQAKCSEKRRRLIAQQLKDYSLDDLRACIDGYALSPFHCGQNPAGQKYDSIELFMRDSEHVEKGIQFARDPPKPAQNGGVPRQTRYEELTKGLDDGE